MKPADPACAPVRACGAISGTSAFVQAEGAARGRSGEAEADAAGGTRV